MEMLGEQHIPATRQQVWEALNDTELLKASMPGCESFEATGENTFVAAITAKVGPVKAKFKFNVELNDIDPPNGYTINGEGQGGAAGFARGSATVNLTEEEGGTRLAYSVQANVGGKLAQLGGRLIDGTAKKMADEFFGTFCAILSPDDEPEPRAVATEEETTALGSTPAKKSFPVWLKWVCWAAVVIAAALILRGFA